MTDWWNRAEHLKEILAWNDLEMACGCPDRVEAAVVLGLETQENLETCARWVPELTLKIDLPSTVPPSKCAPFPIYMPNGPTPEYPAKKEQEGTDPHLIL